MSDTLEQEIFEWRIKRWPSPEDRSIWAYLPSVKDAAKLAEETGEVVGVVIKLREDRGSMSDLADEIGDVLITLAVLAGRHNWKLGDLLAGRWKDVSQR
jgi:NTP pyrophosphatase (non-canonical NTP hydrolase)